MHKVTDNGSTPLWMAAAQGHRGVVEVLIKAGADLDKASPDSGATPLHSAATQRSPRGGGGTDHGRCKREHGHDGSRIHPTALGCLRRS